MRAKQIDNYAALRSAQARRVMPLIGPLLDALNDLPNDTREEMEMEAPLLFRYLAGIQQAIERE